MAQEVYEAMESRSLSLDGGTKTGSRTFHVFDDAAEIQYPAQIDFGSNGLPELGDEFPGDPDLFASSFKVGHVADSGRTWKVEFSYSTAPLGGVGGPQIPTEIGYLQISVDYGAAFRDFYRSDPGLNYQGGTPTGQDIAGQEIDSFGEPLSVLIPQQRIVIDETVSGTELLTQSRYIRDYVGSRNAFKFYGSDIGKLLYEGCSAKRIGVNLWSLSHRFAFDGAYHMVQQPRKNGNREVELENYGNGFLSAGFVRWVQPYPDLGNFRNISRNF